MQRKTSCWSSIHSCQRCPRNVGGSVVQSRWNWSDWRKPTY